MIKFPNSQVLKFLSLLFATHCLLLTANAFSDIDPNDPYASMFYHLRDVGIMTPFEDGTFQGYKTVSRAEALTISLRAAGIPLVHPEFTGDTGFADIDPNAWYASVVDQGLRNKVIFNNSQAFRPHDPVTKAGFLGMLFRSTRVDTRLYMSQLRNIADDVDKDEWYAPFFAYAKKYQVAHLPADNKYLPFKFLNRREVGIMTYRQLKLFHGGDLTKNTVELQAQIKRFISLIRDGKTEEAEFHLHRIITLNDKLTRKQNSADLIATKSISRSMDHLTNSLRYMQYQKELPAIEHLLLALKQARKAGEQSESLRPLSEELAGLVKEMLMQVTNKQFMISG
ncbi:MAG TPA: S-layer homology domain-containing protein [Candidatus Gracilibacteria bacterium]